MANPSDPPEHELLRVRGLGFSWSLLTESSAADLAEQFDTAERLVECTRRHGLLTPATVSCDWELDGMVVPVVPTSVEFAGRLDDPALPGRLIAARASDIDAGARMDALQVEGVGTWIDADGGSHEVEGLLLLTVDLMTPALPGVRFEVFHDIWMTHDFRGRPHQEICERNAPRLASMIREFEEILGAEADADPHSMFGTPRRFGIDPPLGADGRPLDVTWWL